MYRLDKWHHSRRTDLIRQAPLRVYIKWLLQFIIVYLAASLNISLFFGNDCRYPLCRRNKPVYDSGTGSASLPCWHHCLMPYCFKKVLQKLVRFWKSREAKRKQKPQVYYVGFFPVMMTMMMTMMMMMTTVCLPLSLVISADSFHSARTGVLFPIWIRMTKHGVVTSLFFAPRPMQPASQAINMTKASVIASHAPQIGCTEARMALRDSSQLCAVPSCDYPLFYWLHVCHSSICESYNYSLFI